MNSIVERKKLKWRWTRRLILGLVSLGALSFSVTRLQSYRVPFPRTFLEMNQYLNDSKSSPLSTNEQEIDRLQQLAQTNNTLLVVPLVMAWQLEQMYDQEMNLASEYEQALAKGNQDQLSELLQAWKLARARSWRLSVNLAQTLEYSWAQELNISGVQGWMLVPIAYGDQPMSQSKLRSQKQALETAYARSKELSQKLKEGLNLELAQHGQTLLSGDELKLAQSLIEQAPRNLFILVGSILIDLTLLVVLLRQRILIGELIFFLPEEYVAELGALYQIRSSEKSIWEARFIVLSYFLELLLWVYTGRNW